MTERDWELFLCTHFLESVRVCIQGSTIENADVMNVVVALGLGLALILADVDADNYGAHLLT